VHERFNIPQKLYGREAQVSALLAAFERVAGGRTEFALVAGHAGVGKTALVQEVRRPILQRRGYFISGKFDQFQRNLPYAALIQAFRRLIRQILTESERRIAIWRENLLGALGSNGQIIIDVIPEVELIIGPQPAVLELPTAEAQNRFNLVFQNFVRTFTSQEHALVVFLDDLQWADRPSLELMARLLTQTDTQYLFIIGAFRDNEVDSLHPLTLMLDDLQQSTAQVGQINLQPLELADVNQLVAEALKCDAQQAQPLAQLCLDKTDGNPLFLIHLLYTLVEAGWLYFDHQRGQWDWDMGAVGQIQLSGDVVDLMLGKMRALSEQTLQALQLAACIGNEFEIEIIAGVNGKSVAGTVADLQPALKEGLVQAPDQAQQFMDPGAQGRSSYRFLHDRVQQAAYSLIPEAQKQFIHLQIGRSMLQKAGEKAREEKLFDIVNQLNFGRELVSQLDERLELAQLNLLAGVKAKDSNAYGPALQYLTVGADSLPADSWQDHYALTFDLYREGTECAYLNGDFEAAETLFDVTVANARTELEKVAIYTTMVDLYTTMGNNHEAVALGVEALKMLGVRLPSKPEILVVLTAILRIILGMRGRKIETLVDLPYMTESKQLAAMRLLMSMAPGVYFVRQDILASLIMKMVQLSLSHGNAPEVSPFGYTSFGLLIGSGFGQFERAYRFGKLGLAVSQKSHHPRAIGLSNFVMGAFVNNWRQPTRTNYEYLLNGYQYLLESGNLHFAGYAVCGLIFTLSLTGLALDELYEEAQKYFYFAREIKDLNSANFFIATQRHVLCLQGLTRHATSFSDEHFDEQEHLLEMKNSSQQAVLGWYYIKKMQVLYLLGHYAEALQVGMASDEIIEASFAQIYVPEHYFYYALTLTALYPAATAQEKRRYRKILRVNLKKMKVWADNCPESFQHRYLLMAAEIARCQGQMQRAMELYDQAIQATCDHGYPQNEALANELKARLLLAQGRPEVAQLYMKKAYYGYQLWGADAKTQQLQGVYPDLLADIPQDVTEPEPPLSVAEGQPATLEMALPGYTLTECVSEERHVVKYQGFSQDDPGEVRSFMLYKDLRLSAAELAQLKATYAKLPGMSGMGLVEVHEVLETPEGLVLVLEELS